MAKITEDNKSIAGILFKAFDKGEYKIQQYNHCNLDLHVDLFSKEGSPEDDLTSYGTIGLSDHPMPWENGGFPTRIELCGAGLTSFTE